MQTIGFSLSYRMYFLRVGVLKVNICTFLEAEQGLMLRQVIWN